MTAYRKVEANAAGRDFVVGDIHGMFDSVERALAKVDFDPERDRLFSVGDLIDRGPQSRDVVRFLKQPFVHAVCGNHDDACSGCTRDAPDRTVRPGSMVRSGAGVVADGATGGGRRARTVAARDRGADAARQRRLPARRCAARHGLVDVLCGAHAGSRISPADGAVGSGPHPVPGSLGRAGIGRVFVGHTPQRGGLRRYGNVYVVDAGAVYGWLGMGGHLTCVNIEAPTEGLEGLRQVGSLDVVDLPAPHRPFGAYARTEG